MSLQPTRSTIPRRSGTLHRWADPVTFVDIERDSLAGYLAAVRSISRNARKAVRSEMLPLDRSPIVIEVINEPSGIATASTSLRSDTTGA
jgi:hypothetical protein